MLQIISNLRFYCLVCGWRPTRNFFLVSVDVTSTIYSHTSKFRNDLVTSWRFLPTYKIKMAGHVTSPSQFYVIKYVVKRKWRKLSSYIKSSEYISLHGIFSSYQNLRWYIKIINTSCYKIPQNNWIWQ